MMDYNSLRHFADSWGLLAMLILFGVFIGWTFRKGANEKHEDAAQMIFKDEDDVR
ncbi:cbb3-type cytochrome c oxidase subunit 3 [Sphingorhabdus arenilitoris]|uniref:Cbb3-type cytochrome c oxidase subunit 3 n=1 Tax=Sphingorhabdus arenilitoris TaxID=1490041 RepID=A0ABV8RF42_9SPHN